MQIWGPRGLGAISTVNFKKMFARRLRIIILLHLGLITFRIHFWKTRKTLISSFSDLADVTMTPETNYIRFGQHQDTSNNTRKYSTIFGKYYFWKCPNSENRKNKFRGRRGPTHPDDTSNNFPKS